MVIGSGNLFFITQPKGLLVGVGAYHAVSAGPNEMPRLVTEGIKLHVVYSVRQLRKVLEIYRQDLEYLDFDQVCVEQLAAGLPTWALRRPRHLKSGVAELLMIFVKPLVIQDIMEQFQRNRTAKHASVSTLSDESGHKSDDDDTGNGRTLH